MPPKQRQVRIEQRGAQAAIEALEQRSDEELETETKYKSAALAMVRPEFSHIGGEVDLHILGETRRAIVVPDSLYDPKNTALRS